MIGDGPLVQVAQRAVDLERAASALLYFAVDDLDARVEALRASGVEIVSEPATIFGHADATLGPAGTEERMAFLTDSEGNTIALVEHRKGATP